MNLILSMVLSVVVVETITRLDIGAKLSRFTAVMKGSASVFSGNLSDAEKEAQLRENAKRSFACTLALSFVVIIIAAVLVGFAGLVHLVLPDSGFLEFAAGPKGIGWITVVSIVYYYLKRVFVEKSVHKD